MSKDGKLVLIYALIVAAMTLLYVTYEDIGLMNHARATPAAAQVDGDDD
jgi:hypothetical protein